MVVENLEKSRKKLTFDVTKEEFEKALDKAFLEEVKKVTIPGFRKGKAPRSVFEKNYGVEALFPTALDFIFDEKVSEITKDQELVKDFIGQFEPTLDEKIERGKDFKVSLIIDVYPEVTLGAYKGVEVKKQNLEVSDDEVNKAIESLALKDATKEAKENATIENGDYAIFDFVGTVDGVEFPGGKADNYELKIGSGQFIPGFEDQMVGMNIEEKRDVKVTFPEDYHAENLKGKEAVFEVVLHEIKQRVVPTLSDEFVKDELEIENVNNVKEYRDYIKEIITKDRSEAAENKFTDDCVNKAVENATMEIPEGMVDSEVNLQIKQIERQAKMYNMPVDLLLKYSGIESLDAYKETIRPSALMAVKQRVVLDEIAKAEKLKVTKADYDKEIKEVAKEIRKSEEEARNMYSIDSLKPYILNQKAIKLIKDSVYKEEK